jgi:hypothetical protein
MDDAVLVCLVHGPSQRLHQPRGRFHGLRVAAGECRQTAALDVLEGEVGLPAQA